MKFINSQVLTKFLVMLNDRVSICLPDPHTQCSTTDNGDLFHFIRTVSYKTDSCFEETRPDVSSKYVHTRYTSCVGTLLRQDRQHSGTNPNLSV